MGTKDRVYKYTGSRKVFITYIVCFSFIAATMFLSIIAAVATDRHTLEKMAEHIVLCFFAVVLLNIPLVLQSKFKFRIPAFLHIIIAVFIVAHFMLGDIFRFYDNVFIFDKLLHTTAGIVIAILGFSVVYGFSKTESGKVRLSPFFVALFSFCFALALLTLWEVFEYAMDCLFGMNMQRWQDGLSKIEIDGVIYNVTSSLQGSGLVDTMTDIIVGLIGAAVICVAGGVLIKKYPDSTRFYITKSAPLLKPLEAAVSEAKYSETNNTESNDLLETSISEKADTESSASKHKKIDCLKD